MRNPKYTKWGYPSSDRFMDLPYIEYTSYNIRLKPNPLRFGTTKPNKNKLLMTLHKLCQSGQILYEIWTTYHMPEAIINNLASSCDLGCMFILKLDFKLSITKRNQEPRWVVKSFCVQDDTFGIVCPEIKCGWKSK